MERIYRFAALDGIRGLAAQIVFIGHLIGAAFPQASPGLSTAIGWSSRLAVMVFFVLSGFVIAVSLSRLVATQGRAWPLHYAVHRAARIVPPLVLAVTLVFAIVAGSRAAGLPLTDVRTEELTIGVMAYLRGITLTFLTTDATFGLDGPLWSLRHEVYLYGIAALVTLAVRRQGLIGALAGPAALALIIVTAPRFFYLQSLALFGCGALVALYGERPVLRRLAATSLPTLLALALVALPVLVLPHGKVFADLMSNAPLFLLLQAMLAIPLSMMILGAAIGRGPVTAFLAGQAGLGAWSYTLYVVHNPLIVLGLSLMAAAGLGATPGSRLAWCAALFVAVQLLAWAMARLVEQPQAARDLIWRMMPGGRPAPQTVAGPPSPR